jgi:predicted NAD/FAD-binding protein
MAATKTPLRPRGRGGHATWGHRLALSKESYNALKLLFMTSKRDMIVYFSLKYFTLRRNICQQNKCLCRRLRRSESLAYKAWTSTFLSPLEAAIWVGKKMDMSKEILVTLEHEGREGEREKERELREKCLTSLD